MDGLSKLFVMFGLAQGRGFVFDLPRPCDLSAELCMRDGEDLRPWEGVVHH
jgi:hypothetical protein